MKRRNFIKNIMFTGAAAVLPDFEFLKTFKDYRLIEPVKNSLTARVVCTRDPLCVSNDFVINKERASALFKNALTLFTGKDNVKEAVQSLFPQFHENLRVSIKVNTASSHMPSHPCLAYTIADCLIEAGLKPDNIIVWERSEKTLKDAGYVIQNTAGTVKTIATDTPGYGYDESRSERVHGVSVYLTSIITKHSDYLINLSALKQHIFAGVTFCQKNYYGAIPLYDRVMMIGPYDLVRMHLNDCDPYISELNLLINQKVPTVLYACDCLMGMYSKGPLGPPQWAQNEIILSKDPVAVDTLSLYRIEKQRKANGLPPVMHKAHYIRTSANMGLGTNNPENMEIIDKTI